MSLFGGGAPAFGGAVSTGIGGASAPSQTVNANNDFEVSDPPTDGISAVCWSVNNHLAVASWDKTVRIWTIEAAQGGGGAFGGGGGNAAGLRSTLVKTIQHEAPVLCCAFSKDGTVLFSGGCDNKLKMTNLQTGQEQLVGCHNGPIKAVFWSNELQMIVTGSWDKTLKFWQQPGANPFATINLPERVYGMDLNGALLCVALADRQLLCYDLTTIRTNPNPAKQGETALKMQTRCVTCFPDRTGYALGSIEGRCSVTFLNNMKQNFAFKCHRNQDDIFAVNAISFHPEFGTFATAGSDGTFVFWDKDNRQRLKQFNAVGAPITATAFNANGSLFVYCASYDWHKGHEGNNVGIGQKVFIHKVEESEVKPKQQNRGVARR